MDDFNAPSPDSNTPAKTSTFIKWLQTKSDAQIDTLSETSESEEETIINPEQKIMDKMMSFYDSNYYAYDILQNKNEKQFNRIWNVEQDPNIDYVYLFQAYVAPVD